jgi:hypothetical protein
MGKTDTLQIQAVFVLRKTDHTKGKSLMEEGGSKKELKKVNMVDVLSIQE